MESNLKRKKNRTFPIKIWRKKKLGHLSLMIQNLALRLLILKINNYINNLFSFSMFQIYCPNQVLQGTGLEKKNSWSHFFYKKKRITYLLCHVASWLATGGKFRRPLCHKSHLTGQEKHSTDTSAVTCKPLSKHMR